MRKKAIKLRVGAVVLMACGERRSMSMTRTSV